MAFELSITVCLLCCGFVCEKILQRGRFAASWNDVSACWCFGCAGPRLTLLVYFHFPISHQHVFVPRCSEGKQAAPPRTRPNKRTCFKFQTERGNARCRMISAQSFDLCPAVGFWPSALTSVERCDSKCLVRLADEEDRHVSCCQDSAGPQPVSFYLPQQFRWIPEALCLNSHSPPCQTNKRFGSTQAEVSRRMELRELTTAAQRICGSNAEAHAGPLAGSKPSRGMCCFW